MISVHADYTIRIQLQKTKSDVDDVINVEDLPDSCWNTELEINRDNTPDILEYQPGELICASTLCFEAKQKTSLAMDSTHGNLSTPSSSESSVSGIALAIQNSTISIIRCKCIHMYGIYVGECRRLLVFS